MKIIGVDIKAIETTEDREKFRLKMLEIGVGVCKGRTARSFLEGKEIDLLFQLNENVWNGQSTIQLEVLDIRLSA